MLRLKHYLFGLLMFAFALSSLAQTDSVPENPKNKFVSNIVFQFDNRTERYFETKARMLGLRLGAEFFGRLRLGFGTYSNPRYYIIRFPDADAKVSEEGRLRYSLFFSEFIFFRNFRWEFSVAGAAGGGSLGIRMTDRRGPLPVATTSKVNGADIFDVGLNGQVKLIPWFGLGVGVGYRMLNVQREERFESPFSTPYYDFRIKVFPGYLFKVLFKEEAIELEKSYYQWRKEKRWNSFKNFAGDGKDNS